MWLSPHQPFRALIPSTFKLGFTECFRCTRNRTHSCLTANSSMSFYQLCEVSSCMIPIWLLGKPRLRVVKLGSDGVRFKPTASSRPPRLRPCTASYSTYRAGLGGSTEQTELSLGNSWGHGTRGGGTESTLASKTHPTLPSQAVESLPSNRC